MFKSIYSLLFATTAIILGTSQLQAGPGDTTIVQTFTFEEQNNPDTPYDSPGRRWFDFPEDDGTTYQKILMYHTLKCFEDGTAGNLGFPCGEWDYLSYNYLFEHTGLLDSNLVTHPLYLYDNQNIPQFIVQNEPYNNTYLVEQIALVIDNVIAETEYQIGDGLITTANTWANSKTLRNQYIWTADELSAAGLSAGFIHRLALNVFSMPNDLDFFTIRAAQSNLTTLDAPFNGNMQTLYSLNTQINGTGWMYLNFLEGLEWDGTSSIILDFSCSNNDTANQMEFVADETMSNTGLYFAGDDKYIDFEWYDEVRVPAEAFDELDSEVTISFWMYGDPDFQPQDGTIFEGVNANNQRVLNSHLPWSNGRVYWDAGGEGGYDRIDKLAGVADYEGKWNHWAFTKNTATGSMKIYLNGTLWHSGTNMDNSMAGIVKFSIGAAAGWSNFYNGRIDYFNMFSKELDQSVIQEWLYKSTDNTHPDYSFLEFSYEFNDANATPIVDASPNALDATTYGSPNRIPFRGHELYRNYTLTSIRPQIKFIIGEYETHVEFNQVSYDVQVAPVSVASYEADGNFAVLNDLTYYWPSGDATTYNPDGSILDAIEITGDLIFDNQNFSYYAPPYEVVNRYEIGRYITPYGIGLDLGEEGWTWVYDVTDFAPLLKNQVELEAGNWQELLDLKFVFIEGTPVREVKRVERLWGGDFALSTFEATVPERTVEIEDGEEGFRLKATTTGHQFSNPTNCAEFCYKTQSVDVNGSTQYSWQIMQECSANPLYPQGGTWIFDRAGWCPGAPGTTYDLELTPFINGDSFTVDYDSQYDQYGNYVFEGYLITYGEINHQTDVEINDIIAPSKWKMKSRQNPICDNPIIRIRNNGSDPLTSCTITYTAAGVTESFDWTGNLGFLETEDVELVFNDPAFWNGPEDENVLFEVSVSNPNSTEDQNIFNNTATSSFQRPPRFSYDDLQDNRLIIWVGTNSAPWETEVTLYDRLGNVVFHRDDYTQANSTHRDTIQLNAGCYLFHLKDNGFDGLSFFANNDGNGSCRLKRVGAASLITFEPDFGKEILWHFVWETDIVSVEEETKPESQIRIFPNPGSGLFNLELGDMGKNLNIEVFNSTGALVSSISGQRPAEGMMFQLDLQNLTNGIYFVSVNDGKARKSGTVIKQ